MTARWFGFRVGLVVLHWGVTAALAQRHRDPFYLRRRIMKFATPAGSRISAYSLLEICAVPAWGSAADAGESEDEEPPRPQTTHDSLDTSC